MKDYIEERAVEIRILLRQRVRHEETHKNDCLSHILEMRQVLDVNKQERHITVPEKKKQRHSV